MALASRAGAKTARPNLLIIHTDQQSCWTVGAYGGTVVDTPHTDSLARDGTIFRNFFTNSAVCTPSRGCLLTGRYPHAHGAYRNNIELNRDEKTLAHVLAANGYDTGYAGKWHLDGEPKPGWMTPDRAMGFADCRYMFNRGHWKKITDNPDGAPTAHAYNVLGDDQIYTTDWLTTKTIEFMKKERTGPFFFMVSIPDPHTPFTVRPPYDTMFRAQDMPVPSTLEQRDLPGWAKAPKNGVRGKTPKERAAWLREKKAQYCGEVKCIDDNVGRMIEALRETGQLDNTVVVFTTDHGEYMGEHGLMAKNNLYETAYRIPMLVRWPERIPAGAAIDACVSTVDFMPTILGLMGVDPSGREQGRDGSHLLVGKRGEWRDEAFIHHSSLTRAGIFTPEWELAYVKDGDSVLFNRLTDPEQIRNQFDDPACKDVVRELTERIVNHNVEVRAPAAAWLAQL